MHIQEIDNSFFICFILFSIFYLVHSRLVNWRWADPQFRFGLDCSSSLHFTSLHFIFSSSSSSSSSLSSRPPHLISSLSLSLSLSHIRSTVSSLSVIDRMQIAIFPISLAISPLLTRTSILHPWHLAFLDQSASHCLPLDCIASPRLISSVPSKRDIQSGGGSSAITVFFSFSSPSYSESPPDPFDS